MMRAGEMKLVVWGKRNESWAGVMADHWLALKNLTARGAGGGREESWGADCVLTSHHRLARLPNYV